MGGWEVLLIREEFWTGVRHLKNGMGGGYLPIFFQLLYAYFCRGHATYKSPCRSVGPSHFAFLAFLGSLRIGKFVFEHAPAQISTAPAQIISAPAQIITAPAQPPSTGAVVYTALLLTGVPSHAFGEVWSNCRNASSDLQSLMVAREREENSSASKRGNALRWSIAHDIELYGFYCATLRLYKRFVCFYSNTSKTRWKQRYQSVSGLFYLYLHIAFL